MPVCCKLESIRLAVYFPAYSIQAYETTFETTSKGSCAVETSLITLKARTSVPDQQKDDEIGRDIDFVL